MSSLLTPDDLDVEAARLYDSAAWQEIVTGWTTTRTEPQPSLVQAVPGLLLSKTTGQLVAEALASIPADQPMERPLPGRLGAMLPDRLHTWRKLGQPDVKPSVQLGYAVEILRTWGWQNTPYKLRDARGARCVCGALLTASRLGVGSLATSHEAATLVHAELRRTGWAGLIGEWNRQPGRTAQDAIGLLDSVRLQAMEAGR